MAERCGAALEVDGIHTYYGTSHVLQGVSLQVGEGELVALLGRNGVGKTTLVRSIIGFTPPRRGAVRFRGADITRWPPYRMVAAGLGLVPQGRGPRLPQRPGGAAAVAGRARFHHPGPAWHPHSPTASAVSGRASWLESRL